MLEVHWVKCADGNSWCKLEDVDLSGVRSTGVYIIWHGGNPGHVVYVGQGDIAARVGSHKSNRAILAYASKGTLFVTWASVSANQMDGVERYLADTWSPLVGDAHPDCYPVAVNSPW
jgi:hypothetical protein